MRKKLFALAAAGLLAGASTVAFAQTDRPACRCRKRAR